MIKRRKLIFITLLLVMVVYVANSEGNAPDLKNNQKLEGGLEKLELINGAVSRSSNVVNSWLVNYQNNLNIRSHDNKYMFQMGGRIMHDWGFFDEDNDFTINFGNQENDSRFRRVRLYLAGKLYSTVKFKFDIDVSSGFNNLTFKDMYVSLSRVPIIGNIQVGHFKRPASLDSVSSSNFLTFIERSLTNTFFKTRNVGFAFFNQHFDKRLTWFTFINKTTAERPSEFSIDGNWNITSRITGLPYYSEDGKRWGHLGVSWSYENPNDSTIVFNGARDSEITRIFISTGSLLANRAHIIGLEGAANYNQFSIQSEYVFSDVDRTTGPNGHVSAFYIEGSWYLTGEHRHYSKNIGAIAQFKPNQNFNWNKNWGQGNGTGALQLALRYSYLDLNDSQAGISGGEQGSLTFGINWELNSQVRLMYNFIHARFRNGSGANAGTLNTNLFRFQVNY